jgi:DNA-binding NarL/FixJ family response regulator
MVLRVVFADDNFLVREGVVSGLLAQAEGVEVVAAVGDASRLLRAVEVHSPDVVLTDIRMPPTNTNEGIDAAKRIRARHPGIGVVVLSQYVEEDYAFELLAEAAAERDAGDARLCRPHHDDDRSGSDPGDDWRCHC